MSLPRVGKAPDIPSYILATMSLGGPVAFYDLSSWGPLDLSYLGVAETPDLFLRSVFN